MTCEIILYDPKDPVFKPPHRVATDALRANELRYNLADLLARERLHRDCMAGLTKGQEEHWYGGFRTCTGDAECPLHKLYPCAACDWHKHVVRKARQRKTKRVRDFLRTGKIPSAWMKPTTLPEAKIPKRMTDAEANRVVLPPLSPMTGKLQLFAEDKRIDNAERRYLEAMGFTSELKEEQHTWGPIRYRVFSCGCKLHDHGGLSEACKRHEAPLTDWSRTE